MFLLHNSQYIYKLMDIFPPGLWNNISMDLIVFDNLKIARSYWMEKFYLIIPNFIIFIVLQMEKSLKEKSSDYTSFELTKQFW